jgi:hypothetical protein
VVVAQALKKLLQFVWRVHGNTVIKGLRIQLRVLSNQTQVAFCSVG